MVKIIYLYSLFVTWALYQIESALPTLARPIMSLDANEDAIVGALKQSLVTYILVLYFRMFVNF